MLKKVNWFGSKDTVLCDAESLEYETIFNSINASWNCEGIVYKTENGKLISNLEITAIDKQIEISGFMEDSDIKYALDSYTNKFHTQWWKLSSKYKLVKLYKATKQVVVHGTAYTTFVALFEWVPLK